MAPLRILVSGGGIAGPAVAFWLARLGHSCTIVERFPGLRANGQQIDLREQGIDAAQRMGILDEVRRRGVDEAGTEFIDGGGARRAYMKKSPPGERESVSSEFEIMRGDLCRLLFEATEHAVTYRFGVTVDDFADEDGGRGVRVTLSDGSVESYDLLIGADGQGSRIRKKMLACDGLEDSYRSLGVFVCYYTVARQPDETRNEMTVCLLPKRRVVLTRWHAQHSGQSYLFTMSHADELRQALRQDSGAQRALFARIFRDAGWKVPRLLREMDVADDFYAHEIVQVTAKHWSRGRVVLLGDAGYTPSLFTGMGTSLALVGACVLAGEMARHPGDLPGALAAYDAVLRPLVDEVQHLAPGLPGLLFRETELGVRVLHTVLWLLSLTLQLVLGPRIGRVLDAAVPGRRKRWTLPEYPELGEVKPKSS
ncbi:2-polyprenyl-6-methoxyphenol hydroxylase and related FAD-dependent oxidoreductase [Tolypocladium paradoxum]|uniref:2-polyprenyl-6-methoxyphenol hydroxylase and related FAD-dependent oxidoreductase n=1 Tax=Tolypocladium paradoxum TaxID=94208 RepID=A0A2S4L5A8_9HYPO|nr:2-polyprenyl-6-methoxyphenol hydroxylase and related FAD-dependent oxidoreductase [Tolypocladium paradoxum]